MEETVEKKVAWPVVTTDSAKLKLAIALTKVSLSVQKLQDEADSLVFNDEESNLKKISEFLAKIKRGEKAISDEHVILKKPFKEQGDACDAAKRDMLKATAEIKSPVELKYTALCNEMDRRREEELRKKAADQKILSGIESNVLEFSQKIAECSTRKELTDVERLINLEKSPSRATKYGEFQQKAVDRYDEVLIPILKAQKIKVEEREQIELEIAEAEKCNDAAKTDELRQKQEIIENEIIQNQVKVQEMALSQPTELLVEAETIFPDVFERRTDVVCEIVDEAVAFKKQRELLKIELKVADANKIGRTLRDSGAFGDKTEIIVNGIKYSIKKKWD